MLPSLAAGMNRTAGIGASQLANHAAGASTPVSAGGAGFAAVLADVAGSATRSLQAAESASTAAMLGKATARDVVETAMRAEQDLQVALALRDKVVAALQEISRMAI